MGLVIGINARFLPKFNALCLSYGNFPSLNCFSVGRSIFRGLPTASRELPDGRAVATGPSIDDGSPHAAAVWATYDVAW